MDKAKASSSRTRDEASSGSKRLLRLAALGAIVVGLCSLLFGSFNARKSSIDHDEPRVVLDMTFRPDVPHSTKNTTQIGREKATLLMLVRNFELQDALESMRELEDRFNKKYRYPWTFLNDEEFTEEFKQLTTGIASGTTEYGFIPPSNWSVPDHIDQELMKQKMKEMEEKDVIYGGSLSYRNMCRFNSGYFFRHPLLDKYDWYWRVEPDVHFYCDQQYDPFEFMRTNGKMYGFVITIYEYINTIPTLWKTAKEFFNAHPDYLAKDNALDFVTDRKVLRSFDLDLETTEEYNLCHFWSNFEIGNLNFFRSKEYIEFFEHLDRSGGFYYERWGDAPVHTLGLTALLNRSQIHHFSDIGYKHAPYYRCPKDDASFLTGRCLCPPNKGHDVDFENFSCLPKWYFHGGRQFLFNFTEYPSDTNK